MLKVFKKDGNITQSSTTTRKKTTLPKGMCKSEAQKLNRQVLRLLHII